MPTHCTSDRILCNCLQIKESQVSTCVALSGSDTVQDVIRQCGAGGGCTACHRRIREVIESQRLTGSVADLSEAVA